MPLDSPLLALLKLDTTLVALLKSAMAYGGTLSAMPLDSPLLAILKSATLPNVPLLAECGTRSVGEAFRSMEAGEGGSSRRGASGKRLWAALLSAMPLEVDTVLMASLEVISLLANLPDRWKDHSYDDIFPTRGSGGEWAGRCWVGRASPPLQEVAFIFLTNNWSPLLARRLGGHEAAAFALYWLEEASNSGLHFDQAGLDYMVMI